MTYNLYFSYDEIVSAVSEPLVSPQPPNQEEFHEAFKALLENPEFMADDGTLAFGLRHVYSIKKGLNHVYGVLKGSDAVVYQSTRAIGFEPVLYVYVYYIEDSDSYGAPRGTMLDKLLDSHDIYAIERGAIFDVVQGDCILARQVGGERYYRDDDSDFEDAEPVEWVTPLTHNCPVGASFESHRDDSIDWGVCMIVRIGKAGDRLVYPTASEVK